LVSRIECRQCPLFPIRLNAIGCENWRAFQQTFGTAFLFQVQLAGSEQGHEHRKVTPTRNRWPLATARTSSSMQQAKLDHRQGVSNGGRLRQQGALHWQGHCATTAIDLRKPARVIQGRCFATQERCFCGAVVHWFASFSGISVRPRQRFRLLVAPSGRPRLHAQRCGWVHNERHAIGGPVRGGDPAGDVLPISQVFLCHPVVISLVRSLRFSPVIRTTSPSTVGARRARPAPVHRD